MITGSQIRAARALLNITAEELAKKSRVSYATIHRMEASDSVPESYTSTLNKVKKALEKEGIMLTSENGYVGLKLKT